MPHAQDFSFLVDGGVAVMTWWEREKGLASTKEERDFLGGKGLNDK